MCERGVCRALIVMKENENKNYKIIIGKNKISGYDVDI